MISKRPAQEKAEAHQLLSQHSSRAALNLSVVIFRAYRVELDPNNRQRTVFLRHAGAARFAWNWGLARRIEEYERTGKCCNVFTQQNQFNALKKTEFAWMSNISARAPIEALHDLDQAFQDFFRRVKAGKKPGFPKFKSRKTSIGNFRLRQSVVLTANQIRLPCIGWIRMKEHGYIPTSGIRILSATISERAGHWFVSVICEQGIAVPVNAGIPVGVDLGVKHLAVTSDGRVFDNPRPLKKLLKKLKRLSRQHSRKQKGGQNRKKAARRLAKLHYRIACVRRDALHKVTTNLAKNHSLIAVEDLNVQGMMKNHNLAQAISDVSFAEFRRQLEYKCGWYGSRLVVVGRFFPSSKTCSGCGCVKEKLALSERVFQCEACGMVLDRDLNAARNILVAASSVETLNACGAERQCSTMKQEANTICSAKAG